MWLEGDGEHLLPPKYKSHARTDFIIAHLSIVHYPTCGLHWCNSAQHCPTKRSSASMLL
jgi:hypothetical protein